MQPRQIVRHFHLGTGAFTGRIGLGEQGVAVAVSKPQFRVGEHPPYATAFIAGSGLCRVEVAMRQVSCRCPVSGAVECHRTIGRRRTLCGS